MSDPNDKLTNHLDWVIITAADPELRGLLKEAMLWRDHTGQIVLPDGPPAISKLRELAKRLEEKYGIALDMFT
jgi:hypothetical protein